MKFSVLPEWGDDLGSEHERYVAEKVRRMASVKEYKKQKEHGRVWGGINGVVVVVPVFSLCCRALAPTGLFIDEADPIEFLRRF